jgi:hypothetical protein
MKTSKKMKVTLAQRLLTGTREHLASTGPLVFGGGTYTPGQIETALQTIIDLRAAVEEAKAATKAKLAVEGARVPPLHDQMSAYVAFVRARFGNAPDVLADFGLKPRKAQTPLSVDQQTAAAAKRAATRIARHTMGSRQKKRVKGTVTTTVTPG